jgi:hypothetical protein
VTWFNPPYSANVKTNIGRDFLKLIESAFPPSNPLHKLFTRQTVKISYKCMPSMAHAVARHNVKTLKDDPQPVAQQPGCNCRGGTGVCPVQGRCLTESVVYRATVTDTGSGSHETYTGVTGNTFKERYNGHSSDIRNVGGRNNTGLAYHIWKLKDEGRNYGIQWNLVDRATFYTTRQVALWTKGTKFLIHAGIGNRNW